MAFILLVNLLPASWFIEVCVSNLSVVVCCVVVLLFLFCDCCLECFIVKVNQSFNKHKESMDML